MKYIIASLFTLIMFTGKPTMAETQHIPTHGVHHIGLTVKDLKATSGFFIDTLGFKKVGGKPDYPSIFVSDGTTMVTLWQVSTPEEAIEFDRKNNIGLHHMAFKLETFEDLDAMHEKLKAAENVKIEFAPELVGEGPAKHMMFREPGGIRLEFIVIPKK